MTAYATYPTLRDTVVLISGGAVAAAMRTAGRGSIINLGSISAHIDLLDLTHDRQGRDRGDDPLPGARVRTRRRPRQLRAPGLGHDRAPGRALAPPGGRCRAGEGAQCLPHALGPDDIARMVLWLAADDSRSCTGQRWIVGGGWMSG
jgi:hypothetical protein